MLGDFRICLLFTLKRYFKRKIFLFSIILLPIMILMLGVLTEKSDKGWKVALYTEEAGIADKVCQRLTLHQDFITFYTCKSEEDMRQDVMSKRAECGVFFREGFDQGVQQFHFDDQVMLFYAPSSIAQKMVREEVFAAILAEVNEVLLTDFMEEQSTDGTFEKEKFLTYYRHFVKDGNVFHFEYEEVTNDNVIANTLKIVLSPIRGMLAIFIWAEVLLAVLLIYADEKNGIYKVMRQRRRWFTQFSILGIPAILSASASLIVIYCGHVLYGLPILPMWEEFFWLIGYGLLCTVSAMCIYYCCRNAAMYVLLVTVLLIAGVVLCPVFFTLQLIAPRLSMVQYLLIPGSYIARFLTGKGMLLWLQLVAFTVIMVLLRFLNRKRFI